MPNASNCRPIALSTIISKLFELFILHHIKPNLGTECNQQTTKPEHSTCMRVFLLKQVPIFFYTGCNTFVYAAFLDASKAFAQVNRNKLFKKFLSCVVSMCFIPVWLLHNWCWDKICTDASKMESKIISVIQCIYLCSTREYSESLPFCSVY